MDCDDAMLLLARAEPTTLPAAQDRELAEHVATCEACQALDEAREQDGWRWLVRVHPEALDDRELLVLPMVDPIVFESGAELARGGMGRISRAFDRRLGREVAIKESLDDGLRARFEREVQITARLQHPAIVPIYEAGTFPDGSTFYTMRLVPGRNLHDAIADATTLEARLRLMPHVRAVADALAYAHARGVIHRDLKPGNVLVGEFGETIVIDWGLAKELDRGDPIHATQPAPRTSNPNLTRVGAVIGTPFFMSPGQAAGAPANATDDVYALGAILYHLLSGTPPYYDTVPHTSDAAIAATLEGPPTPLDRLAPEAPADLRAIVERAMARDKADRFPTAKEFAEELARFEAGQLLASRSYTARELLVRWLRKHRRAAIVAVVGAITAITLAIVWMRYRRAAEELALRERGVRLTAFYSEVARQASRIDRQLFELEIGVEGLAEAAGWALAGPEPAETKVFTTGDFADPDRRPDDFRRAAYRWEVSLEYPVVALAPGVVFDVVQPKLARLAPLRHHIRDMVVNAAGDHPPTSATDITELLRARRSPIDYAYVDLEEGVHMVWPGTASLREGYDARTASFYTMSKNEHVTKWGAPYVDSSTDRQGDDLVLPCTKGVWSPTGRFLGVAGVELTVTKLVDTTMSLPTRATVRTSLVDHGARTVVDSREAGQRFAASGKDEALVLPAFDLPDIVEAIGDRHEGILETTRDGHPIVVALVRLEAIEWTYVVEIAAETLDK